jgi:hypothetical protein
MKTIAERVAELIAAHGPITDEERREVIRILGPAVRSRIRVERPLSPRATRAAA